MVTASAYYGDQAVGGDDGEHGGEDDAGGARVNRLESFDGLCWLPMQGGEW